MKHYRNRYIASVIIACSIFTSYCGEDPGTRGQMLSQKPNEAPVADAGADQRVYTYVGRAGLDGSGSYDPDGTDLSYSWSIVYQPAVSSAAFSDTAGSSASLTFDLEGTYEIMLTVSDGSLSSSDLVTVNVAVNQGPTAEAGINRQVSVDDYVILDGSASSDPEGDPLTCTWVQILGPTVGTGELTGANPGFTAPSEVCTIAYDLYVDDGGGYSFADRVYIYVMKDKDACVFVSTGGDDANDGTDRLAPKRTIQAAIDAAAAPEFDLYMSGGIYNESPVLASGVSIYGGFDPSTWLRYTESFESTILGGTIALDGNGISDVTLDGLIIRSADADIDGQGSYGIRLIYSSVALNNCIVIAGNGAPGLEGADGADGAAGSSGGKGDSGDADDDNANAHGGAGGASPAGRTGGRGGDGGEADDGDNGSQGLIGTPGGSGGDGGDPGSAGSYGSNGSDGANGINGTGGNSGSVTSYLWVPASGSDGTAGGHGNGGGGGGGGGGQDCFFCINGTGNGGGGGGGGGAGGSGGSGGTGGGASFGLFLIGTDVTVENCDIRSGSGGDGGDGGSGGGGGSGGNGGQGGDKDAIEVGKGGDGGNGGRGGTGGHGGGGSGGPSFAIYKDSSSSAAINATRLAPGSGGLGGASEGNPGSKGESVAIN